MPVKGPTLVSYTFKPHEVIVRLDLEHFKINIGLQTALLEIISRFLYSMFIVSGFLCNKFENLT